MKRYQPTLVENRRLGPGLYSLWVRFGNPCDVQPGQFFEFATGVRFLRRAFSVADKDADRLRFVLRVVGAGTRWLSEFSQGSRLDISGPLGRGVVLPAEGPVMLLAGGVGAAALLYLARKLNEKGIQVDALLAAARSEELILAEEFRPLCRNLTLATDDGSCGRKGRLTDVLPALPDVHDIKVFYTCGPEPMFASIKRMGLGRPVYAFLESRMGCGTGLCVGCAVRGRDGRYRRVCTEGPVFNLEEIEL
jgi:dihydroorotate dehydrogenase electron transfer subunit